MILNNNSTQQINTLVIQLQNKITNLTNEFRKLNNNINDLNSEISDLEKRVNSNENDAAAMNTEILANTEAISGKADKIHTHTKSEITDFPTSLEGFIKSKTVKVGNIKIPTSCYFEISVDLKSSDTVISAKLSSWTSNTGVFSIICYGKNRVFIVGDIGTTIIGVSLLVFYI